MKEVIDLTPLMEDTKEMIEILSQVCKLQDRYNELLKNIDAEPVVFYVKPLKETTNDQTTTTN